MGPSSGVESMKVMRGVPVLTPNPVAGRRADNGPLIESGHSGEKYDEKDTQYSLKARHLWFGIPEANTTTTDRIEHITINNGTGSMTTYATDTVSFGDQITWMPPPVNTENFTEETQATRGAYSKLGSPGFIPTRLLPVTHGLLTDSLTPMIVRAVEIFNKSPDNAILVNNMQALKNSPDTVDKAVYWAIYMQAVPAAKVLRLLESHVIVALWGGILEQKGAEKLERFISGADANAINASKVAYASEGFKKESKDAFNGFHMAISSMKEAVRPIGVALDAANPGETFRICLK